MTNLIHKLKAKKGFTLVELIVVIAIIAILTAVIIPIIARYAAQGQYTVLQDTANTISDSASSAITDGNQLDIINITRIEGVRTNGELEITLRYDDTEKATATISKDGIAEEATGDGNNGEKRTAERLCDTLATTLPDNCAFIIDVSNSAVTGVIYTNKSADVSDLENAEIGIVEGFDKAYADEEGKGEAVGVSGKYIPAA